MKPQGFASCFWTLVTPEACKHQKRFMARKRRFICRFSVLRLAMKRLRFRSGMKHSPLRAEYEASRFASKVMLFNGARCAGFIAPFARLLYRRLPRGVGSVDLPPNPFRN